MEELISTNCHRICEHTPELSQNIGALMSQSGLYNVMSVRQRVEHDGSLARRYLWYKLYVAKVSRFGEATPLVQSCRVVLASAIGQEGHKLACLELFGTDGSHHCLCIACATVGTVSEDKAQAAAIRTN